MRLDRYQMDEFSHQWSGCFARNQKKDTVFYLRSLSSVTKVIVDSVAFDGTEINDEEHDLADIEPLNIPSGFYDYSGIPISFSRNPTRDRRKGINPHNASASYLYSKNRRELALERCGLNTKLLSSLYKQSIIPVEKLSISEIERTVDRINAGVIRGFVLDKGYLLAYCEPRKLPKDQYVGLFGLTGLLGFVSQKGSIQIPKVIDFMQDSIKEAISSKFDISINEIKCNV